MMTQSARWMNILYFCHSVSLKGYVRLNFLSNRFMAIILLKSLANFLARNLPLDISFSLFKQKFRRFQPVNILQTDSHRPVTRTLLHSRFPGSKILLKLQFSKGCNSLNYQYKTNQTLKKHICRLSTLICLRLIR